MSVIVDQNGNLIPDERAAYSHHYAADVQGKDLASWMPWMSSGDTALLQEMDLLRARSEDAVRNSGPLWGAKQLLADNAIGGNYRLNWKPDHEALGISPEEAQEFAKVVMREWQSHSQDHENRIHTSQRFKFSGLLTEAFFSRMVSFEALAVADWRPNRGGKYATCVRNIDPARLSNPDGRADTERLRGGVTHTARDGSPQTYHISNYLEGDFDYSGRARRWQSVAKYTSWGRRRVYHYFDPDRPSMSRGRNGLVSVLANSRMTSTLKQTTLQAAILNAMYTAVIESSYDWRSVQDALNQAPAVGAKELTPLQQYMQAQTQYTQASGGVRYNGAQITQLFPGEQLKFNHPNHPSANFESFAEFFEREMAAGLNMSRAQFTRDFSKSNYAGLRAELLDAWKAIKTRRSLELDQYSTWVFMLFLEEALEISQTIEYPANAARYWEAQNAYALGCDWRGPAQGHIDPLREVKAKQLEVQMGINSLEQVAAENGTDWRRNQDQMEEVIRRAQEKGERLGVDWRLFAPQFAHITDDASEQNTPGEENP